MSADAASGPPADSWVAAVHASERDFEPLGAALVIDHQRVLTSAHVILTAEGAVLDPLWIAFPKAERAMGRRCKVASVAVAESHQVADVALLILEGMVPAGVIPATLRRPRPTALVKLPWWAFGFANADPVGNSADGTIGAALGYGWIRLDTESRYHMARGFSGGGLWIPDYGAVVGIVGAANDKGDGRAFTLFQAEACFPEEKLRALTDWSLDQVDELALASWGWTLEDDPEAGRHWRPRARGLTVASERGFRFRGRSAALKAIVDWLDRSYLDRRALVVTGSPGVGKSAVLGRVVTTAEAGIADTLPPDDAAVRAPRGSVACAVHAKGKTAVDVAIEIARAASAALPEHAADLAPKLRDALSAGRSKRFNVIIDAIDEAATPAQARAIINAVIRPLVESCADVGAQVIAGTRRRDDGGDLLKAFGNAISAVDLDDPYFFSRDDLAAYAMATLQLVGDERPGSPYARDDIAWPVARRIAELSGRNFLVAGLVARAHGLHDDQAADPAGLSFSPTVDAGLHAYLKRLAPLGQVLAADVLTALAFAETPGLPIDLWQMAVEVIGAGQVTAEQLSWFAHSSAGNFLVDSGEEIVVSNFRLFHQALNDSLLQARSEVTTRPADERALCQAFMAYGKRSGWNRAPSYLLRSLAVHAARAGVIDSVLAEDDYLIHADLRRLIPLADRATSPAGHSRARLLQLTPQAISAAPEVRVALFSVTETLENLPGIHPRGSQPAPYRALWAAVRPRTERAVVEGHTDNVNSVCVFTLNERILLASASTDRTVRVWDPATGEQQQALEGHVGWVRGVCAFTRDGQPLLASASDDETVRIWNPATGEQQQILEGHAGAVRAVCAFTHGGQPLLASASDDETVRIWNPATGGQQQILEGHAGAVRGVCAFTHGGQPLLASASADRTIRIWDPATGEQRRVLEGHTGWVNAACAFTRAGQPLLASASDDETVRIWDPATGEQQQQAVDGHTGWVNAVCAFARDGQPLLASASDDETVRIWDAATGEQQRVLNGHADWVRGVCAFTRAGQPLLASASDDETVRIWNPATGEQQQILEGHTGAVRAVCAFTHSGQPLLASASADRTIRIWDPATGGQQRVLVGHAGAVRAVCAVARDRHAQLASAGVDRTVRIWDPATGEQQQILEGHTGWVNAVCAVTRDGHAMLASASDDRTVRIWDPATGEQQQILEGHAGAVRAVCAIARDGQLLLGSASADRTVRIWDLDRASCLQVIPTHHPPLACDYAGFLVVALTAGLLAIEIGPTL